MDGREPTYLLPKDHWGGGTPKVYGYSSWLEVSQRAFADLILRHETPQISDN
jgi:hypothetical protein